ncbi:subtilisin family serine protease [Puniceicoccus vermicola]|uniref:S8 family serine peptidase n=1 Tax=Puniceicoccus vermicola TaxID=388746 RepID=A0A7X1B0L4_9BACT|nr:S8 family serine peptidase [Puniceicoccus vermicola]MBC2603389.1 S8 family serine peptidase [Puniceicoccus vermicola]
MKYLLFLILLPSIGFAAAFVPDDPYFDPFTYDGGELYAGQWHLLNQAPVTGDSAGLDVNIWEAWSNGFTGAGVIIGIVDDGTQGNHPDLIDNFENDYSWGFGKDAATNLGESYRGGPVRSGLGSDGDSHGTSVAGVSAARGDNGIGMTGAAPYSGIAGLRLINAEDPSGRSFGEIEAAAILYQGQTDGSGNSNPFVAPSWDSVPVRVKNHSYGPQEGFQLYPGFDKVVNALEESASHGVIHVWASGNQRMTERNPWPTADASKSLSGALPENIIVAALGSDGKYSSYSSYGSSVFVTAPSSGIDGYGIATTDRTGSSEGYNKVPSDPDQALDSPDGYNYTSRFGGTSSASPLVAGVMALGVAANPDMDHRMAKHILVSTSRVVDAGDSSSTGRWIVNGAGNAFNNNYGFGLVDAGAFTETATRVDRVTEQTFYSTGEQVVNRSFASEGDDEISESFVVAVDPAEKQALEYVMVEMTIIGLETDWNTYEGGSGVSWGTFLPGLPLPLGLAMSCSSTIEPCRRPIGNCVGIIMTTSWIGNLSATRIGAKMLKALGSWNSTMIRAMTLLALCRITNLPQPWASSSSFQSRRPMPF